ncbi:MAG: carboxypeptidase-like regulatory domain-containing protein [Terracidiphilus sp.]
MPGSSAAPDAPVTQALAAQPNSDASMLGSIHGVVTNADGSVYEGARIVLTQSSSNGPPAKSAISDSNGQFNFTAIVPGPFQLAISSSGFATQTISGVLRSGQSYETQPIVLPVSTTISEVQVNASIDQIAQEQVIQEEKQRVLGIIPNFYVAYAPNAAPLNSRQKFSLAWRSSIDPITFLTSAAFAGVEQADNNFSGYGQGAQGYAKRFGADYADTFIGTMIGGAIFPSLLKQDPRYFYKGTGTIRSRIFYAIATAVVCKGDNGHWQPNYSGIVGGLAAGGISNLYYPASDRDGATLTFENALTGIAGGAVQNLLQEFVIRKLTPNVPNYGPSSQ